MPVIGAARPCFELRYGGQAGLSDGGEAVAGTDQAMPDRGMTKACIADSWIASSSGSWSADLFGVETPDVSEMADLTARADAWPIG
jgi:hypothetical protein